MADFGALLENDAVVVVRGRTDLRDDEPKIVAMEIRRPELVSDDAPPVPINLPLGALTDHTVDHLKAILLDHPGPSEVELRVGSKVLRLPPEFNVDRRNGLVGELKRLLGPNAIAS
jgi:DNA polymerase-3 subunit alpha